MADEDYVEEKRGAAREEPLPPWLRIAAVVTLSALLSLSVGTFFLYMYTGDQKFEPAKFGVGNLIAFCVVGLLLLNLRIDWRRVSKLGPLEFEKALSRQASERDRDIARLEDRIDQIILHDRVKMPDLDIKEMHEFAHRPAAEDSGPHLHVEALEGLAVKPAKEARPAQRGLEDELSAFLNKYERWAFSPSRIIDWGAQQPGFEYLANRDPGQVRRALQAMVAAGRAETRVSPAGNTLYRTSRNVAPSEE
jgi:hypothetical protein